MNLGTCIHYNGCGFGFGGKRHTCKAGVDYHEAFDGSKPGIFLRLPCIRFNERPARGPGTYIKAGEAVVHTPFDRRGHEMVPCSLYVDPTPEQVQAERAEADAHLAKTVAAIKVAGQWRVRPKPAQDRAEVVECPICKGRLHLSQSAYNGHVHGACETEGCVRWME